jgi:hypothetical protein
MDDVAAIHFPTHPSFTRRLITSERVKRPGWRFVKSSTDPTAL